MNAINGRYSGIVPVGPTAVDRALRKNSSVGVKSYDLDARIIAKVLVRHYGDEAEAVLKRVGSFLDEARRAKR